MYMRLQNCSYSLVIKELARYYVVKASGRQKGLPELARLINTWLISGLTDREKPFFFDRKQAT